MLLKSHQFWKNKGREKSSEKNIRQDLKKKKKDAKSYCSHQYFKTYKTDPIFRDGVQLLFMQ